MMSVVSIVHESRQEDAIWGALDLLPLDDLFRDKVVGIKPNETWASPADLTAVTQADTLEAMLAYVQKRRPRRLLVLGGAGGCETEEVFRLCGLMDVVRRYGVEFVDTNRPPHVRVPLAFGPEKELIVNPVVNEIETWVSLALLKVHDTTDVTLSLKNIGMALPAADYYGHPRIKLSHRKQAMSDFIVGVVQRFPISLAVITGHLAMVDRGPIGGRTLDTGWVIASRDPVAADAVGALMLGYDPARIHHLVAAHQLGLGQNDPARLEIRGVPLTEAVSRFQTQAYGGPRRIR